MSLVYSIREGLAGFRRARFASLASTSAMVVALTLIGSIALLGFHTDQISTLLRQEGGEVEVFLLEPEADEAVPVIERIEALDGVAETRFISQEEAEQIFKEEFGEEGDIFMGERLLPASIKVRFSSTYANVDSLDPYVETIRGWDEVEDVQYNQPLLLRVQQNMQLFSIIAASVGLLIVFASLFLVANTIRLTIYARRLLIRTMKLVGATNSFIRRPFLVEGIMQGLIGGFVAGLIVWGLHSVLIHYVPLLEVQGWPGGHPIFSLLALLGFGMLLGWLGSLFATHRFIKHVAVS